MENLEKDFTLKTEKLNLDEEFGGKLGGLAESIGKNKGVAKIAEKEIKEGNLSQTMACTLTANMDSIYEDPKKFNQLTKENKTLLENIVNNGRGEGLFEKFNNGEKKKEIKNLVENMAKIS